ncbi:MAG: type II secretion system F family protein [Gammaproteobacteria bacterium]|nr:type II secretion system F family protein [Gammaproteobacteria bacterium]
MNNLALLAAVAGAMTLAAAVYATLRRRARVRRRIEPLTDLLASDEAPLVVVPAVDTPRDRSALAAALDRRYPLAGGLRTGLVVAAGGGTIAVALVPALVFFGMPLWLALATGALVGTGLGAGVGSFLEQRKRVQFNDRFLVAVDDFQRLVRFGVTPDQAFTSISETAGEPAKESLRRVALDAELGVALGDALAREAHRVRISELAMLAAIVSTQSRAGGGLAESVGNLADMLRVRNENRTRTEAATSEAKISLLILCCVPFAAIGIQAQLQPDLVETLFTSARHLLGIGLFLIAAGLVVAWLLVRSAGR